MFLSTVLEMKYKSVQKLDIIMNMQPENKMNSRVLCMKRFTDVMTFAKATYKFDLATLYYLQRTWLMNLNVDVS